MKLEGRTAGHPRQRGAGHRLAAVKAGKDVSWAMWPWWAAATPPWTPPGRSAGRAKSLPWCTAGRRSICPPMRRTGDGHCHGVEFLELVAPVGRRTAS
ncbi:MAG: hypothetical protein ACLTYN_10335 [Dysosmobacter welbionis]